MSDWAAAAEFVRAQIAEHPEDDLDTIADRIQFLRFGARTESAYFLPAPAPKAATLKRFLSALRFVERLEKELDDEHLPVARSLRSVPVAAVELISRWIKYDWIAGLDAAEELVAGRYSVEQLRKLEKEARGTTSAVTFGRGYAHRLRDKLRNWASEHFGGEYECSPIVDRHEPPVDILFRRKDNPQIRAGVAIFGPHKDYRLYDIRKSEFLTLVVGLSIVLDRVVAIVPQYAPDWYAVDYWRWLATNRVDRQNIELFSLAHNSLSNVQPLQVSRPA